MPLSFHDFPAHVRAKFSRSRDYQVTFGSPAGQRVLADLLKFSGMGQECFVPGQPDATNHNLGMRRVGLRICAFLNFDERQAAREAGAQDVREQGEYS